MLRRAVSGLPARCLYSSRQTKPVAIAVVVAMAGMMRPAWLGLGLGLGVGLGFG